jgi:hypothetical protein
MHGCGYRQDDELCLEFLLSDHDEETAIGGACMLMGANFVLTQPIGVPWFRRPLTTTAHPNSPRISLLQAYDINIGDNVHNCGYFTQPLVSTIGRLRTSGIPVAL